MNTLRRWSAGNKREELAEALFAHFRPGDEWRKLDDEARHDWRAAALVAIRVMAAPTAAQITEGFWRAPQHGRFGSTDIIRIYNAMIRIAELTDHELRNR